MNRHSFIVLLLVGFPALSLANETKDGVRTEILLQTWGTIWDGDENPEADPASFGDPEHDPGLSIHRARLGMSGDHGPIDWSFKFGYFEPYDALDFGEEPFLIQDAYLGGKIAFSKGHVRIAAGLQKVPYSREQLMGSKDLLFQERAVNSQWLSPSRDLGAVVALDLDFGLRAQAGVFNGIAALSGDDNVGKTFVGRIEYAKGDTYTTVTSDKKFSVGVGAGVRHDSSPGSKTFGVTGDAMLRYYRTSLLLEFERDMVKPGKVDIAPPEVLEGTQRLGSSAQLSTYFPLAKKLGGIEPGVRFAWLDMSTKQKDNGDVGILQAGAVWRRLGGPLDLGLGYIHRFELGGTSISNDTVRLWAQFSDEFLLWSPHKHRESMPTPITPWANAFLGKWTGDGTLAGAVLSIWRQPGQGLLGSITFEQPLGRVTTNQHYPLDRFEYDGSTLVVRMNPYDEDRDLVWFELKPEEGKLCGLGYEDGRRKEALQSVEGAGSRVCWVPSP